MPRCVYKRMFICLFWHRIKFLYLSLVPSFHSLPVARYEARSFPALRLCCPPRPRQPPRLACRPSSCACRPCPCCRPPQAPDQKAMQEQIVVCEPLLDLSGALSCQTQFSYPIHQHQHHPPCRLLCSSDDDNDHPSYTHPDPDSNSNSRPVQQQQLAFLYVWRSDWPGHLLRCCPRCLWLH